MHPDAIVAAANATSHPTAGGSLNISHVERSGGSGATASPGREKCKRGQSRSQSLQWGRTEQIARLFLRFIPYYAARWQKRGTTNYSPTQGHFTETKRDSMLSVNSWCKKKKRKTLKAYCPVNIMGFMTSGSGKVKFKESCSKSGNVQVNWQYVQICCLFLRLMPVRLFSSKSCSLRLVHSRVSEIHLSSAPDGESVSLRIPYNWDSQSDMGRLKKREKKRKEKRFLSTLSDSRFLQGFIHS